MIKKKYFLITFILVIIFQTLLYTNNNKNTSFRFLKWSLNEVSIGKLTSISFFSGLFISTLLNNTSTIHKNKNNNHENNQENNEVYYEPLDNEINIKSNVEIPPQRDIREAQPTISVNYRVIKNTEENNLKKDENYTNKIDNEDDWEKNENDW